jgi:hypothetical protein
MGIAALISWLITASGGLYLLIIWLIENDADGRSAVASRLPLPVISGHALLATAGLGVWLGYLVTGRRALAWASCAALVLVALLGLTMVSRWIRVYRAVLPDGGAVPVDRLAVPAERNFPLFVVLAHGLLGATTIVLVLLATIRNYRV